jgi:hypothetical protein
MRWRSSTAPRFPPDVRDLIDELAGLRPDERGRLERFADAFERVDAGQYALFSEVPSGDRIAGSEAEAVRLVGGAGRRMAVKAAVRAFVDEATIAYSRRMSLPDTFLLFQSLPDRAQDRVWFLGSVERAVVAVILWDELTADGREILLGPWTTIAHDVVDGVTP